MNDGIKSFTEHLQTWTQLILALTALGTVLVKLIKDARAQARGPQPADQGGAAGEPPSRLTAPQRLAELALALAYAALFSLLWTYALGVSGGFLDLYQLAGVALLLALLIGATLVLAWYRNQSAAAVAGLAALSFVILAIAPGGAFSTSRAEGAPTPVFPLLVLSIVAGAYLLYLRGRSAGWLNGARRRWIVPAALAGICLLGALAGGVEFSRTTFEEEGTPHLESDVGRQLFRRVSARSAANQELFYQLASEIALVPYYRERYMQPPADLFRAEDEEAPSWLEEDPYADLASAEAAPAPPAAPRQAVKPPATLRAVGLAKPEVYMLNRLRWVHPLGTAERKANIPVPGRTAVERLERTASHRMYKSLSENRWFQGLLNDSRYSYPEDVQEALATEPGNGSLLGGLGLPVDKPALNPPGLLPALAHHGANSILKLQMAFPADAEARMAFAQYRKLALDAQRDRRFDELAREFEELPPQVRRALVHYLADQPEERYALLRELAVVATQVESEFNPIADVAHLESQLPGLRSSVRRAAGAVPAAATAVPTAPTAPTAEEPPATAAVAAEVAEDTVAEEAVAEDAELDEETEAAEAAEPSPAVERLVAAIRAQLQTIGSPGMRDAYVDTLAGLLRANDADVPVTDLFLRQSLEFAGRIGEKGLTAEEASTFFGISSDPVSPTVRRLAQQVPLPAAGGEEARGQLLAELDAFRGLAEQEEKEAILDLLAHKHYKERPDDFVALAMANVQTYGYHLDVLLATVFLLPLFLGALFLASWLSRTLSARDVLRQSIAQEVERGASPLPPFAIASPVIGRTGLLGQLSRLARKGWGTIALVGQRGVGKTRILQELLMGKADAWRPPAVGVWITSPARFDEREFIGSTLEQVATQVERTVAHHLGAEPLAARRLEVRLKRGTVIHLALLVAVFNAIFSGVEEGLAEPMLVLALAPTFLVLMAAVCAGILYLTKVQPVDLGSWLQARQSAHSQAVLMYREAMEALEGGRQDRSDPEPSRTARVYRRGLLILLGLVTGLIVVSFVAEPTAIEGVLIAVLAVVWLRLLMRRPADRARGDASLMSLLRTYRDYVASVVRRIELGALGEAGRRPGLVVCVDELDKVVDLDEVREFVRRIKGIFEVPGVHYYLSLAEDAFGALYLGTVDGKNEIDSSFDHIVRVRPLNVEEAAAVAEAHCRRLGIEAADGHLTRAVAAVTYGVPRDALRLCDEIATMWEEVARQGVGCAITGRRELEARLAYELRRVDRTTCGRLAGEARDCCELARRFFEAPAGPGEARSPEASRVVLSCWLLALVERALAAGDETLWHEVTAKVCELGGQVSIVRLEDLVGQARAVDDLVRRGPDAEQAVA